MNPLAQIDVERRGGLAIARIRGEIDASNASWAGARLRAVLTNRSETLAIDMTGTAYIDSAGIALLFGLADELRVHQQQLKLVVADGSAIARMIEVTGLGKHVPTYPSLDAALAPPCSGAT